MKTLRSYVAGRWHEASTGFRTLVDPCSEEPIARASSAGIDFGKALEDARKGGASLRRLSFGERGEILARASATLHERRDELIQLSLENTGTTRRDAKFDIDGATGTLSYYGTLGRELGDRWHLVDGDGVQLGRSPRFWGRHVLVPLQGTAVHINAFNFPVWGFAEKASCAILAGMPVVTKPATSSALVTERAVEILVEASVFPADSLSLVCGTLGDLLDRLGPQDVVAFTGSATTAAGIKAQPKLSAAATRINVEADSLNAAILGPDVKAEGETWGAFVRDVTREITQKSGQKCTAVRRILVPAARVAEIEQALAAELARVVVGNPRDEAVTLGPLATADQLKDAIEGIRRLREVARLVHGTGERVDGVSNPQGKGFFFGPTLLRADDTEPARPIHEHEVFAPAATILSYDGTAGQAVHLSALGGGTLVTSLYTDDEGYVASYLATGGSSTGRLYVGSEKVAPQLLGSGLVLPALTHGGPGRAGGGQELGGLRGLELYMQRVAVSGDKAIVERLVGGGTDGGSADGLRGNSGSRL